MLRSTMYRALSSAVFAALLVFGPLGVRQTQAQSLSISPERELDLKAAPGELTTESITFENTSDQKISISASYISDSTIGVDMPSVIVLQPKEKFDFLISFLGIDGAARGEITLTEGNVIRHIDLRGNVSEQSSGSDEQASASVFESGNKEIALSVGPNPVESDLTISLRNAASSSINVTDVNGKIVASAKSSNLVWNAAHRAGTYFVTVRGITTSGKPFNETRKVSVR